MSFSTTTNRIVYTGDGAQTVFAYTYLIYLKTHLEVRVDGVLKTVDTDYTVSGVGVGGGGNVTFVAAPASGKQVLILRVVSTTQEIVYQPNDRFPEKTHEKGLDLGMMAVQQFDEKFLRTIKLPVTSTLTNIDLPVAVVGKESFRWNAAKTAIELFTVVSGDTAAVITTRGDLIRGGPGGLPERVALGLTKQYLKSNGTDALWDYIVSLRESGGPTTLDIGAWADLDLLGRSGTNAVGVAKATQAEAEAGTDNAKWMTALRTAQAISALTVSTPLRAGLTGLALSNNGTDPTNDINIAVGETFSNDSAHASRVRTTLASSLIKQLDAAWAVGNNAGMRDTGAISDATWHIFLIKRTDTGVVDILASLSQSAPTMPTNYDKKKWIGAIIRVAGVIKAFTQYQDDFLWNTPVLDVDVTNPGTGHVSRTLTVPAGLKVFAEFNLGFHNKGNGAVTVLNVRSPDTPDQSPSRTASPLSVIGPGFTSAGSFMQEEAFIGHMRVQTNASGQVRTTVDFSDANVRILIATLGWSVNRAEV